MKEFLIIGNSAAGVAGIESIRKNDKQSKITVISDEDYNSYCRCLISYYLSGEVKEDKILYRPESFYKENNINLLLNKKVVRIDPKKNRVILEDKSNLGYDSLLIATGASPKIPEITGIKKKGVFGFRTIKDAKEIEGLVPVTKTACVLGGGLIGLKAAYGLKKRGVDVKVIIGSKQVLSQMLDFESAQFVQKRLEENGIELILGQNVQEIIGNGDIKAVKLDSGKAIGCSLVIVGKGVSPNIGLIKDTQIKINRGVITGELLDTNIPNIYAAGDVSESFDIALGRHAVNALWPVAVEQGKTAGLNMAGEKTNYQGSVGMNSIEFFGLPIISLGIYKAGKEELSLEELKLSQARSNNYKKLLLRNNVIIGAILIGNIKNSGIFLRLIRERTDISTIKDKLLQEDFAYPDILDLIKEEERIYV
ncbi:MAG: FAD-dependent oxidoreductase [Candidatus Omnitrophica bacterium]|nr:FAD-dependent oxidoreductase [Candidatus Omnitrophota bacterium]MBU1905600.1 FAD-dependent oxidoreductase [Candidatus Omnitrophota bacterium]